MLCFRFLHRISLRLLLLDSSECCLGFSISAIFQTLFVCLCVRLEVLIFLTRSDPWICLLTHVPLATLGRLLLSLSHRLPPRSLRLSRVLLSSRHLLSYFPWWDHLFVLVLRWVIGLVHDFWVDCNLTLCIFFGWPPLAPGRKGSFLAVDDLQHLEQRLELLWWLFLNQGWLLILVPHRIIILWKTRKKLFFIAQPSITILWSLLFLKVVTVFQSSIGQISCLKAHDAGYFICLSQNIPVLSQGPIKLLDVPVFLVYKALLLLEKLIKCRLPLLVIRCYDPHFLVLFVFSLHLRGFFGNHWQHVLRVVLHPLDYWFLETDSFLTVFTVPASRWTSCGLPDLLLEVFSLIPGNHIPDERL